MTKTKERRVALRMAGTGFGECMMVTGKWHDSGEREFSIEATYPPPPPFFGTVHSKGVAAALSVSAESKGLICTKMVQNLGVLGTAHSKGLSREDPGGLGRSARRLLI